MEIKEGRGIYCRRCLAIGKKAATEKKTKKNRKKGHQQSQQKLSKGEKIVEVIRNIDKKNKRDAPLRRK